VEYLDESYEHEGLEYQNESLQEVWQPAKLTEVQLLDRVITEIVDTEKDYLKNLKLVIEGYKKKMEERGNLFPKEQIQELFGNIEDIYSFHVEFAKKLEASAHSTARDVGLTFLQEKEKFKIYSHYCTNHPKSTALLEEYNKTPNYKAFLVGCKLLIDQILPLEGFLLTPIQRLCKYPLLLKEMLKYTPEGTPEYQNTQKAMGSMKEAASFVNEIQRTKENKKMIDELQSRIEGWEGNDISEHNSELLLESVLSKISHAKAQDRRCFLFEKLFVYCKEIPLKKNSYQFKGRIKLEKLVVKDLPDNEIFLNRTPLVYAIQFDRYDLPSPKTYVLCCPTKEEKDRWIRAIQLAQSKLEMDIPALSEEQKDEKKKEKKEKTKPPPKEKAEKGKIPEGPPPTLPKPKAGPPPDFPPPKPPVNTNFPPPSNRLPLNMPANAIPIPLPVPLPVANHNHNYNHNLTPSSPTSPNVTPNSNSNANPNQTTNTPPATLPKNNSKSSLATLNTTLNNMLLNQSPASPTISTPPVPQLFPKPSQPLPNPKPVTLTKIDSLGAVQPKQLTRSQSVDRFDSQSRQDNGLQSVGAPKPEVPKPEGAIPKPVFLPPKTDVNNNSSNTGPAPGTRTPLGSQRSLSTLEPTSSIQSPSSLSNKPSLVSQRSLSNLDNIKTTIAGGGINIITSNNGASNANNQIPVKSKPPVVENADNQESELMRRESSVKKGTFGWGEKLSHLVYKKESSGQGSPPAIQQQAPIATQAPGGQQMQDDMLRPKGFDNLIKEMQTKRDRNE